MSDDPLADVLLSIQQGGNDRDRAFNQVEGAFCTEWNPVTKENKLTDGLATFTNLFCVAPDSMQIGRVLLLKTGGRPIILGPMFGPGNATGNDFKRVGVGIVARRSRTTFRNIATEDLTPIMSTITNRNFTEGRTYRISAHAEMYSDNAGECVVQAELRYTLDGTDPTVSSPLLTRWMGRQMGNVIPITMTPSGILTPTGSGPLRALLCVSVFEMPTSYYAGGDSVSPAEIMIEDLGPNVTATGTIY